jgi:ribosome modulation factor
MKTQTPPPPIKRSLICTLTDEERRNYGIKLATTLEDIENVEAEKKRSADHFKDRVGGLQATADDLRRKVSTGQEWRDVECVVKFCEPDKAHKQIVRTDTGEVVSTEIMTESDKQLKLPIADEQLTPEELGRKAEREGKEKEDNPFDADTEEDDHSAWLKGWEDSQDENNGDEDSDAKQEGGEY